jgi:mono/diheme cytochrome c family protein
MTRSRALQLGLLCSVSALFQTACEKAPDGSWRFIGQPKVENRWKPASEITDFTKLYTRNCLGCHSNSSETVSAAIALDNPTYLSILPEATLHSVIANGIKGTLMPGFAKSAGGELTNEQIDILVKGILAKKPATPSAGLPSYNAAPGNAENGKVLFAQSFAKDLPPEKTYLNPAFLGTVSDQYVRTLVIVGLPQLGFPDYRNFIPGRALTDQEVSDVVAFILSHRTNEFGQPLATTPAPAAPSAPAPSTPATP